MPRPGTRKASLGFMVEQALAALQSARSALERARDDEAAATARYYFNDAEMLYAELKRQYDECPDDE